MRLVSLCAAVLALLALGVPAAAQSGVVEKTEAELALQKASSRLQQSAEARSEAETGCAAGEADACFLLGDMMRRGNGGQQDYKGAAEAYQKACTLNHAGACAALAYLATNGKGIDQDLAEARSLYKQSCDLGDVSGCAGYGNMLFTGQGGRKNVAEGTRVLRQACDRDYDWACERARQLGAYDPEDDTWERLKDAGSRF